MEFERRKAAMLASLGSSETDKSPKGTLDAPIIPLIQVINSHPYYFTTSSCSGRISILSQPSPSPPSKPKKKALGGSWLFITHELVDPDSVVDILFPPVPVRCSGEDSPPSDLVFRFEPFILAVECRDVSSAQSLVSAAIASGFRESGITGSVKRVIVAIRCSIRLEVPLGSDSEILVSREYVRWLVRVANGKMEANRRRTDGFYASLIQSGGFGSASPALECANDSSEEAEPEGRDGDGSCLGFDAVSSSSLSVVKMDVVGEPVEKVFIWGHSACELGNKMYSRVLIFGGFGGMGRHGRRNDCFSIDPITAKLETINLSGGPSPRLGHTACVVGRDVFLIGGRAGPECILSDVWVLNTLKNEWKVLECSGDVFPPRHRHAAAVRGELIYVFGGLNNDEISSSLHVLDTNNMQWKELSVKGEKPCARHSHSMVAYGPRLYMFGGYNGDKAVGDLYSFDLETCQWKKEEIAGRGPHARFSHSMFVYKKYVGIIGGCPVRQHFQELSILDVGFKAWRHVKLESSGEALFLRSTASVVGDELIVIGGGAACYAFGTKFSEPVKINLLPLMSLDDSRMYQGENKTMGEGSQNQLTAHLSTLAIEPGMELDGKLMDVDGGDQIHSCSQWVLRLGTKHAKTVKDVLKKFGWLDLSRKVHSCEDGIHICFPIHEKFRRVFHSAGITSEGLNGHISVKVNGSVSNDISCLQALNIIKECGATILMDEVVNLRKTAKSPFQILNETISALIKDRNLPATLLEELPTRWERLGDIVVLPISSFTNSLWNSIAEDLWPTVARSLSACRLARQGRVAATGTRDSKLEILVGDSGWVDHRENGIIYSFDAMKCMFSWGNLSEKRRMANLDCRDEVIVDLFAGIGYFVLPFLVGAKAKLVYACEWNPFAVEALKRNLGSNSVKDRCIVLEGDNRATAPKGVADRVCLGLIPTSEGSWVTAVRSLRSEGGMLHIHGNVKDTEEASWIEHVSSSISGIATNEGLSWEVTVEHSERVKWYAPHIRHLVVDVQCKPQAQRC